MWLTECGVHLPAATPPPWSDMNPADESDHTQFVNDNNHNDDDDNMNDNHNNDNDKMMITIMITTTTRTPRMSQTTRTSLLQSCMIYDLTSCNHV